MRGECIFSLIFLVGSTVSMAAESFPYKAAVKASETTLRSGPGPQYYATGHVTAGDEIEVYERKGGGWLAIRPTVTSFNWVEANKLRMTNDPDVGKVVGNNVVAWVGSELGAVEDHKWQVQLDAGESVQLMSRQSMAIFSGDERRDFYQIAPPAGEFRWVHERDIEPLVKQAVAIESPAEVQLAQFQVVADQRSDVISARDGFVSRDESQAATPDAPRVASLAPRANFQPSEVGLADFDSLAKRLDLELSETVSKEPLQWNLASLHKGAAALLEQSNTTLQRGKARLLLEQIKEFEKLQQSYAGIEDLDVDFPQVEPGSAAEPSPSEQAASGLASERSSADFDPRFDGRGWLLPVHSSRQASPPYALLDQQGQILTFVSPAPGLNLHRYLRKEVGIFGQRSRAEFLNKPHLTADRIVDMERHRR